MAELRIQQDALRDTITINGIRYARALFEDLASALPLGEPFTLVSRQDGVLMVKRLDATGNPVPAAPNEGKDA